MAWKLTSRNQRTNTPRAFWQNTKTNSQKQTIQHPRGRRHGRSLEIIFLIDLVIPNSLCHIVAFVRLDKTQVTFKNLILDIVGISKWNLDVPQSDDVSSQIYVSHMSHLLQPDDLPSLPENIHVRGKTRSTCPDKCLYCKRPFCASDCKELEARIKSQASMQKSNVPGALIAYWRELHNFANAWARHSDELYH